MSRASAAKMAWHARERFALPVHPERLSVLFLQYSRLTSLVKRLSRNIYQLDHNRLFFSQIKFQCHSAEWLLAPDT